MVVFPFPITTTGLHYQVVRSGKVGVVLPSPCPDPLVLEFRDGKRDAFHLRELELCDLSVSRSENSNYKKNKDGNMDETPGVSRLSRSVRCSLFTVSSNVNPFLSRRSVIEKEMGFDCTRILIADAL